MVVFERDDKQLIIPTGLGNFFRSYGEGYEEGYGDGLAAGAHLQPRKEASMSQSGLITPDPGYDAMESVYVDIQGGSGGTYQEGYVAGEAAQKAKLISTGVTQNGTYTRADGYNSITVNVPTSGGGGCNLQEKSYTIPTTAATAITITPDSGYDGMSVVNIDASAINDAYTEGYIYGRNYQRAQMTITAITENGRYFRPDGYDTVVVNVPQSGASYDAGYQAGYDSGFTSGHYTSGSPWFRFSFAVSGTPDSFTGNPMNFFIKVRGTESDYGFSEIISANYWVVYQPAQLIRTTYFTLTINVLGMRNFDTPYEFQVFIPTSEVSNWGDITPCTEQHRTRLNGSNVEDGGGCVLSVNQAFVDFEKPTISGPTCYRVFYRFNY